MTKKVRRSATQYAHRVPLTDNSSRSSLLPSSPQLSKSDLIKLQNSKRMNQKVHIKDIEKMSNNNSLESLQAAKVDTDFGKLQRMLKMLHMSVIDMKQGKECGSEEEVFDILWALQEMDTFTDAEAEIVADKAARKAAKKDKTPKDGAKKEKKMKKVRRRRSEARLMM